MIILNIELNGIYGFNHFALNLTYPKKIVNSLIDNEYLLDRPNFRYKKAIVLIGANATGKTSLGKAIFRIFTFINDNNSQSLLNAVNGNIGEFALDFVSKPYILSRLTANIDKLNNKLTLRYYEAYIRKHDNYKKAVENLAEKTALLENVDTLAQEFGSIKARFAYPDIMEELHFQPNQKQVLLKTLKAVIATLDPSLCDVSVAKDLQSSFVIRRKDAEIIIQNGKLLNRDIMSSGTIEGVDVAMFLAALLCKESSFYYCDEHFSYIHSEIEKRILAMMISYLGDNEQLIFTTHNLDALDMNLPKHSYVFLQRRMIEGEYHISPIAADAILKRNTDSIRCAVENDMFSSLPNLHYLDELEMSLEHGE